MERRLLRHSAVNGVVVVLYICVLIFVIFCMSVVFGDMMSKKTDLRLRAC
jgi:hypothetical protein